ncbi:ImmA/IrrE family metallo-endopeptidase [Nocardia niigatensis]
MFRSSPIITPATRAATQHPYAHNRPKLNLARLRHLAPTHPVAFNRSLELARAQADLLLEHASLSGTSPILAISRMPRIHVEYVDEQRLRGASFWDTEARQWVIQVNSADHWKRQLFAVAHEFKYVLDYSHSDLLYQGSQTRSAASEAEYVADYFARYVLLPDKPLTEAFESGITKTCELAERFGTTENIIHKRLHDLHLIGSDAPERVLS